MKDRFKFRAVMKTDELCIVVPVEAVHSTYYIIDTNVAKEIFDKKYPEKCFFSDFLEIIDKQEYISQYSFDCDLLITKDFTNLIQCTGLKDKNGINSLFEGDIVEIDSDTLAKILWSDDLARFIIVYENIQADFDNYFGYELEIIGNIYENPELLEGEK